MADPDMMEQMQAEAGGESSAPAPMMSNSEQCVPLAALALPDEGEQMANPAPGDPVSYTVEGKVARIEGNNAYITAETVNGQPIKGDEPETAPVEETEPPGEADYNALQDSAIKRGVLTLLFAIGLAFSGQAQNSPYSATGCYFSSNKIACLTLPAGGVATINYVNATSTDAGSTLKLLSLGEGTYARIRSAVASVTITAGGKYAPNATPALAFSGGSPDTAAAGTARLKVLSAEIFNAGTNYTDGDVRVESSDGGTACDLTIICNLNGVITNVVVKVAGVFTNPPANNATITNTFGGAGSNATFNLTYAINSVVLSNVGTNYAAIPTVTFSGTSIGNSNAAGTAVLASGSNPLAAGTNTLYVMNPADYFTAGGYMAIKHTNGVLQLCMVHSVSSTSVVITNGAAGATTLWLQTGISNNSFMPATVLASIPWGSATTAISAPDSGIFVTDGRPCVLALFSTNSGSDITIATGKR